MLSTEVMYKFLLTLSFMGIMNTKIYIHIWDAEVEEFGFFLDHAYVLQQCAMLTSMFIDN